MSTTAKIGSDRWQKYVDGVLDERDALKEEVSRLKGELARARAKAPAATTTASTVELEAELTNLTRNTQNLRRVVRNIINNPLSTRTDVQAKLTLAMQQFEKEMGESWD